jgi:hypothetical protein
MGNRARVKKFGAALRMGKQWPFGTRGLGSPDDTEPTYRRNSSACRSFCWRGRPLRKCIIARDAPVAQLDRAIASGAIGREFESLRAHQITPTNPAGERFSPAAKRLPPGPLYSHLLRRSGLLFSGVLELLKHVIFDKFTANSFDRHSETNYDYFGLDWCCCICPCLPSLQLLPQQ